MEQVPLTEWIIPEDEIAVRDQRATDAGQRRIRSLGHIGIGGLAQEPRSVRIRSTGDDVRDVRRDLPDPLIGSASRHSRIYVDFGRGVLRADRIEQRVDTVPAHIQLGANERQSLIEHPR